VSIFFEHVFFWLKRSKRIFGHRLRSTACSISGSFGISGRKTTDFTSLLWSTPMMLPISQLKLQWICWLLRLHTELFGWKEWYSRQSIASDR
jgi:hypothetical protein